METEKMIMELRRIAKNRKNDRLCTGELNLTDMCTDVADRLEELNEFDKSQSAKLLKKLQEYEDLGVTPEQIREIDRLYAEKCGEVAELRARYEKTFNELEYMDDRNREYQVEIRSMEWELQDAQKEIELLEGEVAELKKKQTPKKPVVVECIHPEWGDCIMGDVDCQNLSDCNFGIWCPNCEESLDYSSLNSPPYCPDCGQKLDWEEK